MPSIREWTVTWADRATTARCHPAEDARAVLVLAHGAGAGQHHPFMTTVAQGLARHAVTTVTFDFPYVHEGRRLPDKAPVLEACFAAVAGAVARESATGHLPRFVGGKSMGGRMATHLAAAHAVDARGVVALGYPLHPPGRPERLRTAHLAGITWPLLVVQGSRDAFGTPEELRPALAAVRGPLTLHLIEGGNHAFAVRGRAAGAVLDEVVATVARWILALV